MPSSPPTKEALNNPNDKDKKAFAAGQFYQQWDSGYSKQQATRPQTLGYGLSDSPSGQAGWVLEKFYAWTDCKRTTPRMSFHGTSYWITLCFIGYLITVPHLRAFTGKASPRALAMKEQMASNYPQAAVYFQKKLLRQPRPWAEQRYQEHSVLERTRQRWPFRGI